MGLKRTRANPFRRLAPAASALALVFSGCESTPETPVDLTQIRNAGDLRKHLDANYRTIPLGTAFHRTRFYLDAVVDGVPGKFLLDTGAQDTYIHRASLEKFGLEAETDSGDASGVGGHVDVKRTEVGSFIIGGKIAVDPGPINVLMDGNAADFDGVIGMNLLDRLRVAVDFGDDTLHFLPPDARLSATLEEVARKAGCREVGLTLFGDLPYLAAKVNGETSLFLLDTGFSRSAIDSAYAEKLGMATFPIPGETGGFGARKFPREIARPDTLEIGGLIFKKFPMLVFDLGEVRRGRPRARDFAGVLGADWLAQNHAVLDIASRRVYFDAFSPGSR